MTMCVGLLLFFSLIAGGVFLYFKVQRLEQEIAKQNTSMEGDDDTV